MCKYFRSVTLVIIKLKIIIRVKFKYYYRNTKIKLNKSISSINKNLNLWQSQNYILSSKFLLLITIHPRLNPNCNLQFVCACKLNLHAIVCRRLFDLDLLKLYVQFPIVCPTVINFNCFRCWICVALKLIKGQF